MITTYEPRGAAKDLLTDRSPEICIVGAAGTGKTVAALYKLHLTCLMVPNVQALIVRQTHASLVASTGKVFSQFVAVNEIASGEVVWHGGSGNKPPGYRYRNGSLIMYGGMDNPGKVLSQSLDRVVADEADQLSVVAWETLTTRMRGSAGTYRQMVACCNPSHPDHWLRERTHDTGNDMRMITSYHRDNPFLFDRNGTVTPDGESYLKILRGLSGVRRARFLEGKWVAQEGQVYSEWSPADNVIDWFQVPKEWPLILSIDFGYNDAFVCQWWRIGPDGAMYLTREIHKSQVLVEDHARHIRSIMEEHTETEPAPIAVVCDHQLEDRKTLERHLRLPTVPAKKGISRGVQFMQARIRKGGNGKPRLYVFKDAVVGRDEYAETNKTPRGLAAEIGGYVWQTIRGTDGIPRELPIDRNNHSLDAARYAVAHLDWHEETRVGNPARQQASQQTGSKWGTPVGR